MVLLAASIFSKDGKPLLSRQFVEMSRTRIEGLLMAFPKLIGTGKQHTFVETESVRYVYQPLEKLYVLLLTTKASNILEDLETLRLFAKVIPEYSRSLDEYDIKENIFDIISAFDEIVALGYKEHVNLAQIRTFTEMDSHEEKIFMALRETQVRETKEKMKIRAQEIQISKREQKPGMHHAGISSSGGFGVNAGSSSSAINDYGYGGSSFKKFRQVQDGITTKSVTPAATSSTSQSRPGAGSKAMRLGGGGMSGLGGGSGAKSHVVDSFVDQLKAEGVAVPDQSAVVCSSVMGKSSSGSGRVRVHSRSGEVEPIHVRVEEKLKVEDNHNSGLANMELHGIVTLHVAEGAATAAANYLRLRVDLGSHVLQTTTHPNIDKKVFQSSGMLQPKALNKTFPVGQDVGLLKWHLQSVDEEMLPIKINCWPSKSASGCSVNIEYELKKTDFQLDNVVVSIPLPSGSGVPTVRENDGEYSMDVSRTHLQWSHEMIDSNNATGNMEFDTKSGQPDDFFPIYVSFSSSRTFTGVKIEDIVDSSETDVEFSTDTGFFTDEYKIL